MDSVRYEPLEHVALRAQETSELGHLVLEVIDAVERLFAGLQSDVVLQLVDYFVEPLEDREGRVDQGVDHEVGQERGLSFGQLRALCDALVELSEHGRRLQMDGDQIARAHIEVVLPWGN